MNTQPRGAAETRKVQREPGGGGAMERGLVDRKSSERENKKTCVGDLLLESKKVSKRQKEGGEAKIPGRMCEKLIRHHYLFTQLHTTHLTKSVCTYTVQNASLYSRQWAKLTSSPFFPSSLQG